MATTVITGVQYSGIWSLAGQANAKALTTWPVPPPLVEYLVVAGGGGGGTAGQNTFNAGAGGAG